MRRPFKPDVLLRFSAFLSWLGTAGQPAQIETNDEPTDKASNASITVLHPQQLVTVHGHVPDEAYWTTVYSGNTDMQQV